MTHPYNIIVTGASSGIGLALAQEYSSPNHNILLLGRNKTRLNQCLKTCKKLGANAVSSICDIKDQKSLERILTDFDKKYPVDLIIANAGISGGTSGSGESYTQLKDIFDTNIYGVINTITPLLKNFKHRKSGQIAIISSIASFRGLPSAPAYSASKACVRFYGDALRGELLKYHVKLNIICPGYIRTPLTDKNNFPMPFIMEANQAAKYIKKKLAQNKPLIIFPKALYYILKLTTLLPTKLSDKIFTILPKK